MSAIRSMQRAIFRRELGGRTKYSSRLKYEGDGSAFVEWRRRLGIRRGLPGRQRPVGGNNRRAFASWLLPAPEKGYMTRRYVRLFASGSK
jgi:hypothetical protein